MVLSERWWAPGLPGGSRSWGKPWRALSRSWFVFLLCYLLAMFLVLWASASLWVQKQRWKEPYTDISETRRNLLRCSLKYFGHNCTKEVIQKERQPLGRCGESLVLSTLNDVKNPFGRQDIEVGKSIGDHGCNSSNRELDGGRAALDE